MARLSKTDVVIIGMGAVGGVVADVLTAAGMKLVGLEAGPRLDKTDFLKRLDEVRGVVHHPQQPGRPEVQP
jgi:gluconate 2-dehydrogenase alpha chain